MACLDAHLYEIEYIIRLLNSRTVTTKFLNFLWSVPMVPIRTSQEKCGYINGVNSPLSKQ
jgi:hypothetical protein